jgi:hypothetical protein
LEARLTPEMRAYKFLRAGGVGAFSYFTWPVGEWVESDRMSFCARGVHACRVRDLPYWIGAELWEAELDGDVREDRHKVVAERGRLVRRIDDWDAATGARFAEACLERTRERAKSDERLRGYADDAEANAARGQVALLGYIAARAAEVAGGENEYAAERDAQAAWLASELGLT